VKQNLSVIRSRAVAPRHGQVDPDAWLGALPALGTIDCKALAADIECLRQARNFRLYLARATSWGEFCTRYVGASQRQVNAVIRQLEEFGPQFFLLTQLTRVPPDAYRAIAAHVTVEGVYFDGERIPLNMENSRKVTDAVAELCRSHSVHEEQELGAGG
jgi:hypothetical protein